MDTSAAMHIGQPRAALGQVDADDPDAFNHCFAEVNGIRMHYIDEGQGPLVILLHGFPYLWYMWRRQIVALAEAGFRVVVPDQRGFGQTDRPDSIEAYDMSQAVGDMVGLMAALGETSAVIVGHDLGAWVAQAAAMLRPDLFRGLVMLNTPVPPRGKVKPTVGLREMAKGRVYHHLYFQQIGKPDRELASDPRKTLRSIFYSVSGSAVGAERWRLFVEPGEPILNAFTEPKEFPSWLSARAIDYYVDEYTRTGFTGALNYYRCRDRNWEITAFLDGAVVRQPSLFIGGAADPSLEPIEIRGLYDQLDTYLPGLRKKVLLPGVGHSAAEERADQVNELLLEFLEPAGALSGRFQLQLEVPMHTHSLDAKQGSADSYLFGRRQAWFAFAMTIALMVFDYVDRQVIVSLFPHMKQDWGLSDKQLGALVSVVSITIALGALPVALFADRTSRVKSIVVMATVWSLATISCMFTRSYGQLLAARALVGLGEAGYGSVGAALIASHFPARMRGALMAGFFAAASVGSVLGVMLGGLIAAHWGWKAAFGVVGFPGLLLALLYLKVRDYPTVELTPRHDRATRSTRSAAQAIVKALVRSRTMLWVCVGGAAQLIVVSAIWSWLPSFLNREYGLAPDQAAVKAALVVLCGAIGSVVWGAVVDRAGARHPHAKLLRDGAAVHRLAAGGSGGLRRPAARPGDVRAGPLRAHRPRRLPDDVHRRTGGGDRDRRDPPRRARHRRIGAGAVLEPVRPGRGSVHRRRAVGRLGTDGCVDGHAGVRPAGGAGLQLRRANLRGRHAARRPAHRRAGPGPHSGRAQCACLSRPRIGIVLQQLDMEPVEPQ